MASDIGGITLREYFDLELSNVRKSVDIAYDSMEKRLEGMNEFRETLKDQASRFITRAEMEAKIEILDKNRKDSTSLVLATAGIIISVLSLLSRFF